MACRLKLACRIMRSSSNSPSFPDFAPRFPWWGPDLQTLRNVVRGAVRKPRLEEEPARLLLPMRDGSGDQLIGQYLTAQQRPSSRNEAPLVVLVHGLGGSSDSAYIQTTSAHLLELGYPVLQLNLRGAGESRPLCREQYHAGRGRDLHDALGGLPLGSIQNGIAVVGYSLGANMVLKYAAEYGAEHCGLRAVISISAPIDLEASSLRFLDARNRFYHTHLLDRMKTEMLSTPGGVSAEEQRTLNSIRTIYEFDEHIVAPRNGFTSAKDYYDQNHARQFLGEIQVPTLLMHALDDPWIPATMYTDYAWPKTPQLEALLPRGGGHVGFHAQGERLPWHDRCLGIFLDRV